MNLLVKIMGVFDVAGGVLILFNTAFIPLQIVAWILIFKGVVSLLS